MTIVQIVAMFFVAALLAVFAAYMLYFTVTTSSKYELKKRLRRLAVADTDRRFPSDLRVEILQEMGPADKLLFKFGLVRKLDALIDKAGVKTDVKVVLLGIVVAAAVVFALGLMLNRGLQLPLAMMPLGAVLPVVYLRIMKTRRIQRFTEQFPDALLMIARSLEAGHAFTSAMQMVGTQLSEPVSGLFRTAYEEQALGVSTREAISHMGERIDSIDLKFFIMAINIHREIGGNLGEILGRLAKTIRERFQIKRQVKVYTAQARLSGYILAVVPVAMAAFFYFTTPGYIEELLKVSSGRYAIAFALAAQVAGFLVIRKIVNIRI